MRDKDQCYRCGKKENLYFNYEWDCELCAVCYDEVEETGKL